MFHSEKFLHLPYVNFQKFDLKMSENSIEKIFDKENSMKKNITQARPPVVTLSPNPYRNHNPYNQILSPIHMCVLFFFSKMCSH